jgi:hypothetical protein
MAQHMRMDWEWQLGHDARALDHPRNPFALKGITAFIHKDIGALARQSTQASQLIALKIVGCYPLSL